MPVSESPLPCDLVAVMAHPDDAELICGGTLALASSHGQRVGVVDLTRGELGTRGDVETRRREATEAAAVLGLTCRVQLGFPDGHVHDSDETRGRVVEILRTMRPKLVITMPREDHHADHCATALIVDRSVYLAGVAKYHPGLPAWRPHAVLHTITSHPATPDLVVDVSSVIETRRRAIACYRSQFFRDDSKEPATRISHPDFMEWIEGNLRRNGFLTGVAFGEGYTSAMPIGCSDPVALFSREPWSTTPESRSIPPARSSPDGPPPANRDEAPR